MSAAGGSIRSRLVRSAGTVRCRRDAGHVTVSVEGSLDHETASALLDTVAQELTSNPNRIDVDLRQVTSFVAPGAQALGQCRDLCSDVARGCTSAPKRDPASTRCSPPSSPSR